VGVFLVKIFGKERASERRNENIIVSGTLKILFVPIEPKLTLVFESTKLELKLVLESELGLIGNNVTNKKVFD
jgi:hypothetical protein